MTTIEEHEDELDHEQELALSDNTNQETITSLLACGIKSAEEAAKALFPKLNEFRRLQLRHQIKKELHENLGNNEIPQETLDAAAKFGRFPERPSDLFLKLFNAVLFTLERDPLAGRVSPSIIGVSGVIPLTIISTIPDIMHHYYHLIIHAQKEVLLATNFWEKGESVNIVGKALRDLSTKAVAEDRQVIVKIMIDHPTKKNLVHLHAILPPRHWGDYDIPMPNETPNVSVEVNNYHRWVMGTFHSKFLVVDRKVALLNSNNIQDRPNLEMMSHFEGDIVNSFYDTFLISWWLPFKPALVCLRENTPAYQAFKFAAGNHMTASLKEPMKDAVVRARLLLKRHLEVEDTDTYFNHPLHLLKNSPVASTAEPESSHSVQTTKKSHHNLSSEELESLCSDFTPFIFHQPHKPFPIALVNRLPHGTPGHNDLGNPQNAAWISAFRYAQKSIFIQSPTLNALPAIDGIIAACRRNIKVTLWLDLGFNDLAEGHFPFQGGTNEQVVEHLYKSLKETNDGKEMNLEVYWYTGKDQTRPLNASQKKRNCHIKFMSVDDQVAIMGNGNMDTQSWFHSQEINAMIDSPTIVKEWMDSLYMNQSTNEYGKVGSDGKWRDPMGRLDAEDGK